MPGLKPAGLVRHYQGVTEDFSACDESWRWLLQVTGSVVMFSELMVCHKKGRHFCHQNAIKIPMCNLCVLLFGGVVDGINSTCLQVKSPHTTAER